MKLIFFGKGLRGLACLEAILEADYDVPLVVVHDNVGEEMCPVLARARETGIPVIAPTDPNSSEIETMLKKYDADIFVLGGYGKIIKKNIIALPRLMCVNLHGGKLPDYRGSSPLNWALIHGDSFFTLSIIRVDGGVDTGPVLHETTHLIGPNDTIAHLQQTANRVFPQLLLHVLEQLQAGTYTLREQEREKAAYYPLRFPDDGCILFDQLTAQQVHNRIRALTDPYPGAFSFFCGRKVKLLSSRFAGVSYNGEPGRIYKKNGNGLLVCCLDRCLWITKAVFEDNGQDLREAETVRRYDTLATVRGFILNHYREAGK